MILRVTRCALLFLLVGSPGFSAAGGGLRVVALEGQRVPGTTEESTYWRLGRPVLNNAGRVAFDGLLLRGGEINGSVSPALFRLAGPGDSPIVAVDAPASRPDLPFHDSFFTSPFHDLSLNDSGQIAFGAFLERSPSDELRGIFRPDSVWAIDNRGVEQLVAHTGDPAPGVPGGGAFIVGPTDTLTEGLFFSHVQVDSRGGVSFIGHNPPAAIFDLEETGIWRHDAGGLTQIVSRTALEAILPGGNLNGNFTHAKFDREGNALIFRSGEPSQLFSYTNDRGASLLASTGDQSPGITAAASFTDVVDNAIPFGSGTMSLAGDSIAFVGVYREPRSDIEIGIRVDSLADLADLAEPGAIIHLGGSSSNNDTPIILNPNNPADRKGVWRKQAGGPLELVTHEGLPAPGAGTPDEPRTFSDFTDIVVNEAGSVAFVAALDPPEFGRPPSGIWISHNQDDLQPVVLEGDPAPGMPEGVLIDGPIESVSINASGRVAFAAQLYVGERAMVSNSVELSMSWGIWAQDAHGVLQLIAHENQTIDVNSDPLIDDLRTIRAFDTDPFAKDDAPTFEFNDRGDVAFQVEFTDLTTGVLISNLLSVPEPTGAALAATMLAAIWARRRGVING